MMHTITVGIVGALMMLLLLVAVTSIRRKNRNPPAPKRGRGYHAEFTEYEARNILMDPEEFDAANIRHHRTHRDGHQTVFRNFSELLVETARPDQEMLKKVFGIYNHREHRGPARVALLQIEDIDFVKEVIRAEERGEDRHSPAVFYLRRHGRNLGEEFLKSVVNGGGGLLLRYAALSAVENIPLLKLYAEMEIPPSEQKTQKGAMLHHMSLQARRNLEVLCSAESDDPDVAA